MDAAPWCYKWVGIEYIWVVLGIEPYTVQKSKKSCTPPGRPKVSHICSSLHPLVKIFLIFDVDHKCFLFRIPVKDVSWHIPFETPDMTKNKIQFTMNGSTKHLNEK